VNVGLKSHLDRRNNASDAIALTRLSITQLTSPRIVLSASLPQCPRIDQSAMRVSAIWFVRELTSNCKLSVIKLSCSIAHFILNFSYVSRIVLFTYDDEIEYIHRTLFLTIDIRKIRNIIILKIDQ